MRQQPTRELYRQAAELVQDRDALPEEREAVAAAETRMRRVQEQEQAARERALAEWLEAEEHERTKRREAQQRAPTEAREHYVHQARVEKVEKFVLAVRGALKKGPASNAPPPGRKSSGRPACSSWAASTTRTRWNC
ncbi:hypothetical protein O3S80_47885 [Streptomyces sp. Lzd4kr]|nr:hypothetical protein [Streptomyces sp. Lzd4kr]